MTDREPAMEEKDGIRRWMLHGAPHRDDGPAVEHPDGTKEWYWHGKLHREFGGPAIERPGGVNEWWRYGERHREPGPAIERPDGSCEYWVFGRKTGEITPKEMEAARARQKTERERDISNDISGGTSRDVKPLRPIKFRP